jgi:uncharacterized membrane protein YgcG
MSKVEKELDEYGKRTLAPLRPVAPIDPAKVRQIRSQFLLQGESFRQGLASQSHAHQQASTRRKTSLSWLLQSRPLVKALLAIFIVVIIVLAGSSATVLAAQDSLPGDQLYPVKTWSEKLRYALTFSTQAKLNLTLDYTNTRLEEISSLVAQGRTITDQTSDQYQQQLNNALELATQMNDTQMQAALQQIMVQAGKQELIVQGLIDQLPPQAQPAMLRLQERLTAQIQWSTLGEADPKTFRMELQERLKRQLEPNGASGSEQPGTGPGSPGSTPMPGENGADGGGGNKSSQSTEMPGGNDQSQPMPGNGNHQPNSKRTSMP